MLSNYQILFRRFQNGSHPFLYIRSSRQTNFTIYPVSFVSFDLQSILRQSPPCFGMHFAVVICYSSGGCKISGVTSSILQHLSLRDLTVNSSTRRIGLQVLDYIFQQVERRERSTASAGYLIFSLSHSYRGPKFQVRKAHPSLIAALLISVSDPSRSLNRTWPSLGNVPYAPYILLRLWLRVPMVENEHRELDRLIKNIRMSFKQADQILRIIAACTLLLLGHWKLL